MDSAPLDVAIVGAGLAGLACAARLRQLGIERFAVLEQGEGVGAFWRGNYDRIRLHSPFHDLPDDGGLRKRFGMFLARDELVGYLERYARHHGLDDHLRLGQRADRVRRDGDGEGWTLDTPAGVVRSRFVVVATAYNRKPVMPALPGADQYAGRLLHSRAYRNAEPFRGQRVLVVGSGNSAAEIALDLAEGGAASVAMWIRAPRHVLSLKSMGRILRVVRLLRLGLTPQELDDGHRYTRTHPEFVAQAAKKDAVFARFSLDVSRIGLEQPDEGPASQMYRRGRVPWFDQGTLAAIDAGRIEVVDGKHHPIESLTPEGVRFADRDAAYDAIVLGTGFEPGLEDILADAEKLTWWNPDMGRRMPRTDGRSRSSEEPTLFFPGFDLTVNGGLSLGRWGFEVADAVQRELH